MEKISVIVPVYNAGAYLDRCIESVLAQSLRDLEICLLDDGSTDGSGAVCDAYAAKDERIRVIHKENEGLMATWMRGVRETKAPYLFFLDSDDWLEPDVMQTLSNGLSSENTAQIVCGTILIDRGERGTEAEVYGALPGEYTGERLEKEIRGNLLGNEVRALPFSRCMKLISRDLIERNMEHCDPSIHIGEDLNIMVPAFLDAERVAVISGGASYHYRFNEASMTHEYDAAFYDAVRHLREVLLTVAGAKGAPQGREGVENEYLFLLMMAVRNELRRNDSAAAASAIRRICAENDAGQRLCAYSGPIRRPRNRLAAFVMKKPDAFRIAAARMIFGLKR